jgi:MoaA/NifB/PqqE/SkfB family radical SAM enzyme
MKPADFALVDFNRAPFLVIWEVTRACALAELKAPGSPASR